MNPAHLSPLTEGETPPRCTNMHCHHEPLICCGVHAYGETCDGITEDGLPPPKCHQHGEPYQQMQFDDWQLAHLHPCNCGADSIITPEPCVIDCPHCEAGVARLNWADAAAAWNAMNTAKGWHPLRSYEREPTDTDE